VATMKHRYLMALFNEKAGDVGTHKSSAANE